MRPRIAICGHAAPDLESAVRLALEEGPRAGIELTLDPYDIEAGARDGGRAGAQYDQALEVRYHFPLGGLELSDPSLSGGREALAAMLFAAESIARAGGTHLTVHAALPRDVTAGPRFEETAARLTELVSVAMSHGVTICLENLRWGATSEPDPFLDLVERSGSSVTFDVGHAASSEAASRGFGADRFARAVSDGIEGAHVYGHEAERHHPPEDLASIAPALEALMDASCAWWVVELLEWDELRRTRMIVLEFLRREGYASVPSRGSSPVAHR
jgi:sugar phosphate isomerase/epimerase